MKVGFMGCGFPDLGHESFCNGPYSEKLCEIIETFIESLDDMTGSITPLNPGADFIWAWCVLRKKVPLTIYCPYNNHTENWNVYSKQTYNELIANENAKEFITSTGSFASWKLNSRDTQITNDCDMLICVLPTLGNKESIGRTILRMRSLGKEVITIDSKLL